MNHQGKFIFENFGKAIVILTQTPECVTFFHCYVSVRSGRFCDRSISDMRATFGHKIFAKRKVCAVISRQCVHFVEVIVIIKVRLWRYQKWDSGKQRETWDEPILYLFFWGSADKNRYLLTMFQDFQIFRVITNLLVSKESYQL